MFRSDLDAAVQRAVALERELKSTRTELLTARSECDQLRRQLDIADTRVARLDTNDARLRSDVQDLNRQLASAQNLLVAQHERQKYPVKEPVDRSSVLLLLFAFLLFVALCAIVYTR
jgi:predicted  nucleic acid-binding Zn-ribbon protein